jgi:hypothetical protein
VAGSAGAVGEAVDDVAVDLALGVAGDPDVAAGGVDKHRTRLPLGQRPAADPVPEPSRGPQQGAVPLPDRGGCDVASLPLDHCTQVAVHAPRRGHHLVTPVLGDLGSGGEGGGEPVR